MSIIRANGKVTRVIDGDTVKVELSVRINRIDAPEMSGKEKTLGVISKEYLEKRLEGKYVTIDIEDNDRYYRLLADVKLGGVNIGEEMLEKDLVEVYSPTNHNNGKLDL